MKPILISYQVEDETVKYYSLPYDERLLELNNKYVNCDVIPEDLIAVLENLSPDELIEPTDLSFYSHLVTTGWF